MAHLGTPQGYAGEVLRLLSLMLHPRNGATRTSFLVSAGYDLLLDHAAQMSPPGVVAISGKPREVEVRPAGKFVTEAMAPQLNRRGAKGKPDPADPYSGPNIAAAILRRAFDMADDGYPELGIMQVIAEQGEAYRAEGVVGAGRDRLSEIWAEYRPVAHIAAAFGAIQGRSLRDRRVFFDWIGLAQDLFKAGGQIGSRFAEPILSPSECWRIALTPTAFGRGVPGNFRDSDSVTSDRAWSQ